MAIGPVSDYIKKKFASVVEDMYPVKVSQKDISPVGDLLTYQPNRRVVVAMTLSQVESAYVGAREEGIGLIKRMLESKKIEPFVRFVMHRYPGKEESKIINYDEFLENLGPNYIKQVVTTLKAVKSDFPLKLTAKYSDDPRLGCNMDFFATSSIISEPLGTNPFDSRIIGHDFGLGDFQNYDFSAEKGF